jgi:phage regulator Rha-like protein
VLIDIRRILEEAEIGQQEFLHSYRNAQNKEQPCYLLPRRECDLVMSGYSVKYRLAIIDRWRELETKQPFFIPQTMSEALRLAADLSDKVSEQETALNIAAPKVEFYDTVTESHVPSPWVTTPSPPHQSGRQACFKNSDLLIIDST